MRINIFENLELWNTLCIHNDKLKEYFKDFSLINDYWWFNLENLHTVGFCIREYDATFVLGNFDCEWYKPYKKLLMHPANYTALALIDLLYTNKNILIEDLACGMSQLTFYLSHLGYTNFNLIDNFSQIRRQWIIDFLKRTNITYTLNEFSCRPTVINQSCYNKVIKHSIPDSTELIILYSNSTLLKEMLPILQSYNFVELCEDYFRMNVVYCRQNKYSEFNDKLTPYIIK